MTNYATAIAFMAAIIAPAAHANVNAPFWKISWSLETCYHDDEDVGNLPGYNSLADCCHQYYTQDASYNDCITYGGGTPVGSNDWYINWSVSPNRCSKNCAESSANDGCGGFLSPHTTKTKYGSALLCCKGQFSWMNEGYCEALSSEQTFTGTGKFYLDSSEQICVKDCDGAAPCGGVLTQGSVTLYDGASDAAAIAACCAAELSWIEDAICESQSNPAVDGTNKWHVEGGLCKKDCVGSGDHCSSAGKYTKLYDDVESCCSGGLGYLDDAYCISRSEDVADNTYGSSPPGYTDKWYVKWSAFACAKDCDGADPACDALSSNAILYDTPQACCSAHLGSVDATTCADASTSGVASGSVDATGTGKFYADYSTSPGRCVRDCATDTNDATCGGVAPRNAGVTLYDGAEACCSAKFSWYQQDLCKVISESAGNGHTDLFYADQGKGQCYKDCASGSGAACNGQPTDYSQPLYDDAADCCAAKLGWINKDTCENKSNNGASAPLVGTNKWFVNWQTNRCDKDCVETNGGGCQGVHDGQYTTFYDDAEACCSAHFGYIDKEFCASRSREEPSSGRYYPNQGESKCYQDCPSGSGSICNGPPSDLSVPMYDSPEDCCSSSIGWANAATCAGASAASLATDQYYANWQLNKCVKNCPTDSGDSACGGIAPSWHDTFYNSASACCAQPAFAWMGKLSDCVKS